LYGMKPYNANPGPLSYEPPGDYGEYTGTIPAKIGCYQQVNMVGHQYIRMNRTFMASPSRLELFQIEPIVRCGAKNGLSVIATLDHVLGLIG